MKRLVDAMEKLKTCYPEGTGTTSARKTIVKTTKNTAGKTKIAPSSSSAGKSN